MGYACPVCETPQADAHHLANHLAFTAVLGNADHESWLDEHAPGWNEAGEDELAERVVEKASEVEFPQVFEDTTGHDHHRHDDEPRPGELFDDEPPLAHDRGSGDREASSREPRDELDPETAAAIEKARELTGDGDESE